MKEIFATNINNNGLGVLTFELHEECHNKIDHSFVKGLKRVLASLRSKKGIIALVIKSVKSSCFIKGWDNREILSIKDEAEGSAFAKEFQECIALLKNLPFPTIGIINGACLGSGLELALGCTYRIGINENHTFFGFPQVKWGGIPFGGGTWMLPKLIGLKNALEMILAGTVISAEKAFEWGLVDFLISEDETNIAVSALLTHKMTRKNHHLGDVVNLIGRNFLFHAVKHTLIKEGAILYPAALVAFRVIQRGFTTAWEKAANQEAAAFSKLAVTQVTKNLIHLYISAEKMKSDFLTTTPLLAGNFRSYLMDRIFTPYIIEALSLLKEGYEFQTIDSLLVDFGMPQGPFELIDELGFEKVLEFIGARFPFMIMFLVEWNLTGKKGGQGFYIYKNDRKTPNFKVASFLRREFHPREFLKDKDYEQARERCVLSIINEAAHCVDEKLVKDPAYVDVAVVQGMGFPAFRGGPIKYADQLSPQKIAEKLNLYSIAYGERFAPSLVIKLKAQKKEAFYQDEYRI